MSTSSHGRDARIYHLDTDLKMSSVCWPSSSRTDPLLRSIYLVPSPQDQITSCYHTKLYACFSYLVSFLYRFSES